MSDISRTYRMPSGHPLPPRIQPETAFDALSIAASGSANSAAFPAWFARQARVVIGAAGADVTVKLQSSVDGTTWFDLVSYAAGATGPQAIVDICDAHLRLSASNAGAAAESVSADLIIAH